MSTPFGKLKYGEYRPLEKNVIEVTAQHIYVQTKLEMKVYWAEPTLSHQGSASGMFRSGLR